ncbi:MFS transporter [Chloroflexota bacterium]
MIVASVLIIRTIIVGASLSFGVFFKSIETQFELSRATTSAIFSLYMALGCISAFVGGWFLDRYGPKITLFLLGLFTGLSFILSGQVNAAWQLFLTYSLLLALGAGATWVATMSTVMNWFVRKRGLAIGIAASGGGIGQAIIAPFATFLIAAINWRMAFTILGGITLLLVLPLSQLLKRDPAEIGVLPDGVKSSDKVKFEEESAESETANNNLQRMGLSLPQALRTRSFWLITFFHVLSGICMMMIVTHVVPYATDIGFSAAEASLIISLMGGALFVGNVLVGIISDRIGSRKAAVACAALLAVTVLSLIWAKELWMLYLFALIYGFANGGINVSGTTLIGDTMGMLNTGKILGALWVGFGIGAALGPIIGGYIFDVTRSYVLAFSIAALSMCIVAVLLYLVRSEVGRVGNCKLK